MYFGDAILEFGFDCKARKLSPKTIDNYRKQLLYLKRYLYDEYRIQEVEEVRSPHIKQFLVSMDDKLNAINNMIKEYGGADAQTKTFSGYIDECWRYAMEHSDTQLKTASRPVKAAAPKATANVQKPVVR